MHSLGVPGYASGGRTEYAMEEREGEEAMPHSPPAHGRPGFALMILPFAHESEPEQGEDELDREHEPRDSRYARGADSELVLPRFSPEELERRIQQVECELKYLLALRNNDHHAAERHGKDWFDAIGNGDDDE